MTMIRGLTPDMGEWAKTKTARKARLAWRAAPTIEVLEESDLEPLTPAEHNEMGQTFDNLELAEWLYDREQELAGVSAEDMFFAADDEDAPLVHDPYGNQLDFEGWHGFHIIRP